MRNLLFILLAYLTTVSAAPLQYYHCIDEQGNAYFGETPPTQCKGEIKTIVIDETPPSKGKDYYSIKNQAKRLDEQRAAEEKRKKKERTEVLQQQLLEQQLQNEQAIAEQQKEKASSDRNIIFYPTPGLTRPHRIHKPKKRDKKSKDSQDEPVRTYRK